MRLVHLKRLTLVLFCAAAVTLAVAVALRIVAQDEDSASEKPEALIKRLDDPKHSFDAEQALHVMGPAAVPALTQGLTNQSADIRRRAAAVLGRIGNRATLPIDQLAWLIQDHDAGVRNQAILSLGDIGPKAIAATNALKRVLTDTNPLARQYAAVSLWKISRNSADSVPVLTEAIASVEPYYQEQIIALFAEMGTNATSAVPLLINETRSSNAERRFSSAKALWNITRDPALVLPSLQQILDRDIQRYKVVTLELLGQMGAGAHDATNSIFHCLNDGDARIRRSARSALDRIALSQ